MDDSDDSSADSMLSNEDDTYLVRTQLLFSSTDWDMQHGGRRQEGAQSSEDSDTFDDDDSDAASEDEFGLPTPPPPSPVPPAGPPAPAGPLAAAGSLVPAAVRGSPQFSWAAEGPYLFPSPLALPVHSPAWSQTDDDSQTRTPAAG
jgi:hypothetical protein